LAHVPPGSKTRRHLLEFWMLEMEAAYYDFDANSNARRR